MKGFIRLLFFALLVFLGVKYVQNNKAQVNEWLAGSKEWLTEKSEEWLESLQEWLESIQEREGESAGDDNSTGSGNTQHASGSQIFGSETETSATESSSHGSGNGAHLENIRTWTPGEPEVSEEDEIRTSYNQTTTAAFKKLGDDLPADDIAWVKAVTRNYSPDSWFMLMQYEGLPQYGEATLGDGGTASSSKPVQTFHYLEGYSRTELLASMETNVHELAHAYFRQNCYRHAKVHNLVLDWDKAEGFIYVSPSEDYFVSVPDDLLFPSRRLSSVIPQHLRTYRYDTYIEGNTSTQSEGVVGLLNELHAYYLGSRFNFDMLDAYQNAEASDATGLLEWVRNAMSSMSAYWEFDYFIREYLLYMKEHAPGDYQALKSNRDFRKAYASVATAYKKLTEDYYRKMLDEMDRLNASGAAEITLKENYLWVQLPGSHSSKASPVFSEDREKLLVVIESGRYSTIAGDFLSQENQ